MSLRYWANLASCGCVSRHAPRPAVDSSTEATTPTSGRSASSGWPGPFHEWNFYGPNTPSNSHRSQPSDASTQDSRTPLRAPLPPSAPASESSRWSPDSDGPDTFSRQVRRSTSKVVMYLRHRASILLQPPGRP